MNRLKLYRIKSGMTQAELAKELDVSQSAVALWEGGATPLPKYRRKLRALFRATEEELFGEEQNHEESADPPAAGGGGR